MSDDPEKPAIDFEDFQKDREEMMKVAAQRLADQGAETPEEATDFLQNMFTGKAMGNIIGQPGGVPDTPQAQALAKLHGLDGWNDDPATCRRAATRALDLDPDCIEAHTLLAEISGSPKDAIPHYQRAVEIGRTRFASLIDDCRGNSPEEPGLWGLEETRPFLRAMYSLSECHVANDELDQTIALEEDLLDINAGDNQGVRETLLAHYIWKGNLDAARKLLSRYPNDASVTFALTPPFLAFFAALTGLSEELAEELRKRAEPAAEAFLSTPDDADPKLAQRFIDALGPEFTECTRQLKEALAIFPWASVILSDAERMASVPLPPSISFGGPYETAAYARYFGPVWHETPYAIEWLEAASVLVLTADTPEVESQIDRHAAEFAQLIAEARDNGTVLSDKSTLPKRNDPCPCGSGKKFKKCCAQL